VKKDVSGTTLQAHLCRPNSLQLKAFGHSLIWNGDCPSSRQAAQLGGAMIRIKSSQKYFTEAEVADLTGIAGDTLREIARKKRLGTIASASVAGVRAESWLFTNSDLAILAVLPRDPGTSGD
jgi:hypothetical protein